MRWLADRLRGDHAGTEATAEDGVVIDRLRSAGVDTSRSLDIAHRLRFQDEASARLAAELVHKRGWTVVVD